MHVAQRSENEEVQFLYSRSTGSQPLTLPSISTNLGRVELSIAPVMNSQSNMMVDKLTRRNAGCMNNSPLSSHGQGEHDAGIQDIEMLDTLDGTNAFISTSPADHITSTSDNGTLCLDRDGIEISGDRSGNVQTGGLEKNQSRNPLGASRTAARLRAQMRLIPQALGGASNFLRGPRSDGQVPNFRDQFTARVFPNLLAQEPDLRIWEPNIQTRFPVRPRNDHVPFPRSSDELELAANHAEEVNVSASLRSAVISQQGGVSPTLEPKTIREQQLEAGLYEAADLFLYVGITVELYDKTFLFVNSMTQGIYGQDRLKGYKLVRDVHCGSKLPDSRLNELVWLNQVDEQGYRAGLEKVQYEVLSADVKRVREVVYTNCPYPQCSFRNELDHAGLRMDDVDKEAVHETGILYCRWKHIEVKTRLKNDLEECLSLLTEEEAIGNGVVAAYVLRKSWRGGKGPVPGGSCEMDSFDVENNKMVSFRQYTLGDCFCGAGGLSRGALDAGLQVAWGFDSNRPAIEAYAKNFARFGTKSLVLTDAAFISLIGDRPEDYAVDVVHYSPPCQAFSPANNHTNEEKDFINQMALFSVLGLTKELKPRIATMEETSGLVERHPDWFDALVNIFTTIGYSLRWGIVRCQEYKIPQARNRLLLVVAA